MASWAPSLDIIIIIIIISVIVDQLLLHGTSLISEALAAVTHSKLTFQHFQCTRRTVHSLSQFC